MGSIDLSGVRIVVTGGRGFLGSALCEELAERGARDVVALGRADFDLRDRAAVAAMYAEHTPDVVVHLAANVGGIGANLNAPGTFFYDNLIMGAEVIEQGRIYGRLEKLVAVGTICAYPADTPTPFREEALFDGYPEPTNAPYGIAKRAMWVQLHSYAQQFDFPAAYLLPVNLFGPGDDFSPATSHVIPAIIRKHEDAMREGRDSVELWGDGQVTREFIYVADAARAIALAIERDCGIEPINIGTGREISIRALAGLLAELQGFTGEHVWNTDMPSGQRRRCLDVRRARQRLGFVAETPFKEGLRRTIAWWRAHGST